MSNADHHIYLIYLQDQLIGGMDYQIDPKQLDKKETGTARIDIIIGNVVLGEGTPIFVEPIAYNDPKLSLQLIDSRKFEGSENLLVQYKVKYQNAKSQKEN